MSESISLINHKIDEIIAKENFQDSLVTTYDLDEKDLNDLLEDVDTISFLTPKKVIVGKNFKILEKEEEEKITRLIKYLENPQDTVLLILTISKLDERRKITKELLKHLSPFKLEESSINIIKDKFKDYKIDNKTINLLDTYYHDDLERLIRECDKLKLAFIDDKIVTYSKARELLLKPNNNQDNLSFDLVRAISLKDKKQAITIYNELLSYNIESYAIMGLLESQYRLLYQVKILSKNNLNNYDIGKILDVHPFRVKKTLELTRYYSLKEIRKIIKDLAKIDFNIKSGALDNSLVLELLLLNIKDM
ncbi:MAG TPA: DNA polymerase III subunit delta [Candidatus Onthousia faecavium]|nr:DNA polymerase III subunit delta [Candidatus Onthousia faecavium]